MTLVEVDLHSREQSVTMLNTGNGELEEHRIRHDGDDAEHSTPHSSRRSQWRSRARATPSGSRRSCGVWATPSSLGTRPRLGRQRSARPKRTTGMRGRS
jgi:hypothetical protein